MKKLLVALVLLGILGGAGYYLYTKYYPLERRACLHMGKVCGGATAGEAGLKNCEAAARQLYKLGGRGRTDDAMRCILQSKSCLRAAGCMGGASLGITKDLFDGLNDMLKSKK